MSTAERHDVARAAGFCLQCMNPSYKFRPRDFSHKCEGGKKSSKFKCSKCNFHLWVCSKHKMENADIFKKLEGEIWEKYQIKFAYIVRTYLVPQAPAVSSPLSETITVRSDSESDSSVVELPEVPSVGSAVSQSTPKASPENTSNDASKSWDWEQVVENAKVNESSNKTRSDTVSFIPSSNCQHSRLSTDEALSHLKNKLKAKAISSPLKAASSGMPQFILGYTKGNTRPLLTLYDTGCLSVLFKEGVPEKELSPAVLKCRGPIFVNGVGNTQVQVNDEYTCVLFL